MCSRLSRCATSPPTPPILPRERSGGCCASAPGPATCPARRGSAQCASAAWATSWRKRRWNDGRQGSPHRFNGCGVARRAPRSPLQQAHECAFSQLLFKRQPNWHTQGVQSKIAEKGRSETPPAAAAHAGYCCAETFRLWIHPRLRPQAGASAPKVPSSLGASPHPRLPPFLCRQ